MYEADEQPQLLGLPEYHCAEAVPLRLSTVKPTNKAVSPNDDLDMKTFLPEDEVRKR